MNPRKPPQDFANGLARWRWIKGYLAPALSFLGITSEDFDKQFLGKDQLITQQDDTLASPFPLPQIEINGVLYEPTGTPPPPVSTNDGWFYIEWDWTPGTEVFDADTSPITYQWNGEITMNTPPRYSFRGVKAASFQHTIDPNAPDSGVAGFSRVLIASRTDGIVTSYCGRDVIVAQFRGLWTILETIIA